MPKQKDHGDLLEIFYDVERDTIKKFRKIIRNAITLERKNIYIDMVLAPMLPADYLSPLVFGTQALKSYGHSVTFRLSPLNHKILKQTPDASHFALELGEGGPDLEMEDAVSSFFRVEGNWIEVMEEGIEEFSSTIPSWVRNLVAQGYLEVIVDLSHVYFITPDVIDTLLQETLNAPNVLKIRILESMSEILESNPQTAILRVELCKEPAPDPAEPNDMLEPSFESETEDEEMDEVVEMQEEDSSVTPAVPCPEKEPSAERLPSNFKIEVNSLVALEMEESAFLQDFSQYFETLCESGKQLYIDLRHYTSPFSEEMARALLSTNFEALSRQKKLTLRLLKGQKEALLSYFPDIEEVEILRQTGPEFKIIGARMELWNVDDATFMEKFPPNFRKLLGSGHKKITVDISNLQSIATSAVEIIVLSYVEAVGRGLSMTLRIRPEMEDVFLRSGRGKSLPLEIVRPEVAARALVSSMDVKKPGLDMSKLRDAIEKDKLSEKVLKKDFSSLHIESRGSVQNWEPAPVKGEEKEVVYQGPEKRREKRYRARNLEAAFAKGTLGKITGRRYPVHNLSQSGACFTSAIYFSRGEPLRVKIFADENVSAEVAARVVWVNPVPAQALFKVGVQFTKMSDLAKIQVQQMISVLNEGQPK